ncbi:MAG: DUF4174 domain-containing protein [Bacteroidota bacterium]
MLGKLLISPTLLVKLFLLCIAVFSSHLTYSQKLEDYRWKQRLVLLMHQGKENAALQSQQEVLQTQTAALAEREMVVWMPTAAAQPAICRQLRIPQDFEGLLLVGKDGGIKYQAPFVVPPQKLFALVDAMPMRRAEIRRKKGQ